MSDFAPRPRRRMDSPAMLSLHATASSPMMGNDDVIHETGSS